MLLSSLSPPPRQHSLNTATLATQMAQIKEAAARQAAQAAVAPDGGGDGGADGGGAATSKGSEQLIKAQRERREAAEKAFARTQVCVCARKAERLFCFISRRAACRSRLSPPPRSASSDHREQVRHVASLPRAQLSS